MAGLYRYAAFISYSSKDAGFAKRLHRALERYGIPSSLGKFDLTGSGGKRNRIYPVFRDREELSAGDLGDQIEESLRASASLIVVCSPDGAASSWVQKEIEFFAAQVDHGKIFAIIPDTAPLADEHGADRTQSYFPLVLRGDALAGEKLEPLAADARKSKDGFRNAWLKIVAGMIGVTAGQILDRDSARRRQRFFRDGVALALVAALAAFAFAHYDTIRATAISWLEYKRFAHSTMQLSATEEGYIFQDCRLGSTDCPTMVVAPSGQFHMGSSQAAEGAGFWGTIENAAEQPARDMSVLRFALSQTEVTVEQWSRCFQASACGNEMPDNAGLTDEAAPVVNVTWEDAQKYVQWLSRSTGHEYRLPTEAEWEYAARAGNQGDYSWGDAPPSCDENAPNGAAFGGPVFGVDFDYPGHCESEARWRVGSFKANAFGLYDMHGNVWEWVQDCFAPYDPSLTDPAAVESDPRGCDERVLRGGSHLQRPDSLRSAYRGHANPNSRATDFGFRVARTL